jgi:hypothetical protein
MQKLKTNKERERMREKGKNGIRGQRKKRIKKEE